MNVKTNSQSCRVALWQEMHVCLFIFLLSFTYTCLEGVFWLYASWWGFLSWRVAYARDVVVRPTRGLFWNQRALSSFRGSLILQALWGTSGGGGFSVIKLSWHSCDTGEFRFLLHIQHEQTGDIKAPCMHILFDTSSDLPRLSEFWTVHLLLLKLYC